MSETFRSLIDQRAVTCSDRIFLIDPDAEKQMSYRVLQENCVRFGSILKSLKISSSSNVGFLMDNGYWTATVFLGTMYNGLTTVPLNAVASRKNITFMVENTNLDLIFVSKVYRSLLDDVLTGVERQVRIIEVDMVNGIEVKSETSATESLSPDTLTSNSPAMILHTSGTVGMPKGAVLSHSNLIAGGKNVTLAQNLTQRDVAFCILPLYHINGQVVTVVAPLVSSSQVVMPWKFSLTNFWPTLLNHKCTWFSTVPTITKYLLDDVHAKGNETEIQNSNCLRFARSASSAMPASMLIDFEETFSIPMLESIGLTETAAPILANPMPPATRKPGSVGIPFGTEVKIIDESENDLKQGEIGEIVVQGDSVISEYYNAPEATQSAFTSDGWFRTGDRGYQDADGYFFVTGRIKELIIKGGENISPREIDDALYRNKAILEAASFGYPDQAYGQVVAVAVVLKENQTITEEELMNYCKDELGAFRTPSRIFFVDDLPKGPSGKIQRLQVARSLIQEN